MKAQLVFLLFFPIALMGQSGDAWHFQIHAGIGQSKFNVFDPIFDLETQSAVLSLRSKIGVSRSFSINDRYYFRTGLGLHQLTQRAEKELRFPDQIDPTCGFCLPGNEVEILTARNLAILLEVPLLLGTSKQIGKTTLYGEAGPALNFSLYNYFVEESEPNNVIARNTEGAFTNRFILLPALNLAVGIEKNMNSRSAYRLGLYAESLLTSTNRESRNTFPIGFETGLQLSWVLTAREEK